jgi:hypothetical protein
MPAPKSKVVVKEWTNQPDAQARLQALRDRDLELANIAQGLGMRERITELSAELHELKALTDARSYKLARRISKLVRRAKRFIGRQA